MRLFQIIFFSTTKWRPRGRGSPAEFNEEGWNIPHAKHFRKMLPCELVIASVEKTLSISSHENMSVLFSICACHPHTTAQDPSEMESHSSNHLTWPFRTSSIRFCSNLGAWRASFHARLIVSASVGGKVAGLGVARQARSPRTGKELRRVRWVGKFFIASCALFERPQPGSPLIQGYGSSLVSLSQPKISAQIALILSKPIESSSMDRTQC